MHAHSLPVAKYLLEHKADMEAKDKYGVFLNSATAICMCIACVFGC